MPTNMHHKNAQVMIFLMPWDDASQEHKGDYALMVLADVDPAFGGQNGQGVG